MNSLTWIRRERPTPILRPLMHTEIAVHNTPTDCWVIISGIVYDVSDFLQAHPGGVESIMEYAGRDCTAAFNAAHAHISKDTLFANAVGFLG